MNEQFWSQRKKIIITSISSIITLHVKEKAVIIASKKNN